MIYYAKSKNKHSLRCTSVFGRDDKMHRGALNCVSVVIKQY